MTEGPLQPNVTIDASVCDGCGACVEACPTDVLRVDPATRLAFVKYPRDCHVCFLCQGDCPLQCLTVREEPTHARRMSLYDQLGFDADMLRFKAE